LAFSKTHFVSRNGDEPRSASNIVLEHRRCNNAGARRRERDRLRELSHDARLLP
jgi:hypothetical protein